MRGYDAVMRARPAPQRELGPAAPFARRGQPLDGRTRRFMEARFGHDFGAVRVHADPAAARLADDLDARALTVGRDIVFGAGRFAPVTRAGRRLLAHELAHVVQQRDAVGPVPGVYPISRPGDAHERDAERAARAALAGGERAAVAAGLGRVPLQLARDAGADTEPPAGVDLDAVLPFASGAPGETVTWDGPTVVQSGQIDPASAIGKAVAAGPGAVREHADALQREADGVLGRLTDPGDVYFDAVLHAAVTAGYVRLAIGTRVATYRDLRQLARLSAALAAPAKQRRQALHAWASQDTPASGLVGRQAPLPTMRQAVIAELDKWKGATEGVSTAAEGKGKFEDFRSAATLASARKKAAREKTGTFTTCIEFLGFVRVTAGREAKRTAAVADYLINSNLVKEEMRAKLPKGAWHDASPGMRERPQPGDLFVLTFAEDVYKPDNPKVKQFSKGAFSHVGWVRSIAPDQAAPGQPRTETWVTVDGGQGQAGKYEYTGVDPADPEDEKNYRLTQTGKERVDAVARTYDPAANELITGEANQPGKRRTLLGWVDVEKLVK